MANSASTLLRIVNGNLPQENGWSDTWEDFFLNGMKHMFSLNLERAGPCQEFQNLIPGLLQKVILRLLRPLETGGKSITPALVHGDLWFGNAVLAENFAPIVYDPSSFHAHNECKI